MLLLGGLRQQVAVAVALIWRHCTSSSHDDMAPRFPAEASAAVAGVMVLGDFSDQGAASSLMVSRRA